MDPFLKSSTPLGVLDKELPIPTSIHHFPLGLSGLIDRYQQTNVWKGIQYSINSPWITHLTFEDDIVIFSEASKTNIKHILDILELFLSLL